MTDNNQLQTIVDRIERFENERAALAADIRDVLAEAKGNGFDPAAIRIILKERKILADAAKKRKADEIEAVAAVYRTQLDMFK